MRKHWRSSGLRVTVLRVVKQMVEKDRIYGEVGTSALRALKISKPARVTIPKNSEDVIDFFRTRFDRIWKVRRIYGAVTSELLQQGLETLSSVFMLLLNRRKSLCIPPWRRHFESDFDDVRHPEGTRSQAVVLRLVKKEFRKRVLYKSSESCFRLVVVCQRLLRRLVSVVE